MRLHQRIQVENALRLNLQARKQLCIQEWLRGNQVPVGELFLRTLGAKKAAQGGLWRVGRRFSGCAP